MTVLDKFENITGVDIQSYLSDFSSFVLSDYQEILGYYRGSSNISSATLNRLYDLEKRMYKISDLFNIYDFQLSSSTCEIWEVLDMFEQTKVSLLTVLNSIRWMRSTKTLNHNTTIRRDATLKQGQTLEQLADEVGYTDIKNDWSNIALDSNLREEDYSFEGGNRLKVNFAVNTEEFSINSVVEGVWGENLYGRDLDRNFILDGESNDFKILDYRDNIRQQTEILVGLIKGSVPEFPLDGIDKEILGSNINSIQYPVVLRQQAAVFEKDDRYKSISINRFDRKEESLHIEFEIETKLGDKLSQQL